MITDCFVQQYILLTYTSDEFTSKDVTIFPFSLKYNNKIQFFYYMQNMFNTYSIYHLYLEA